MEPVPTSHTTNSAAEEQIQWQPVNFQSNPPSRPVTVMSDDIEGQQLHPSAFVPQVADCCRLSTVTYARRYPYVLRTVHYGCSSLWCEVLWLIILVTGFSISTSPLRRSLDDTAGQLHPNNERNKRSINTTAAEMGLTPTSSSRHAVTARPWTGKTS